MSKTSLKRYTNLAATLHVLQNRCLTLLSPATWDDRNDAFFMSEYKAREAAQSVLALCFAEAPETYHHWRVFSHGSDGVCLEFDKDELIETLANDDRIKFREVTYKTIVDARSEHIKTDDLPFLKRYPYIDENEFRIIYVDTYEAKEFMLLPISLKSILRITLSPWMPKPLSDAVKNTLHSMKGCRGLRIYRSTLLENERWMDLLQKSGEHLHITRPFFRTAPGLGTRV